MISAGCKLPWSNSNVALIKGAQVWHSDWRDTTENITEWVGRNFRGSLPSWNGVDGALELPWSTSNVALINGGEVWHSDWPTNHTIELTEWARTEFTGSLPSWSSIDAGCKLPWSTKNVALFNGAEVWHSDWRGTTMEIQDWARRNFTGTLPSWNGIDGALQLPWSSSDVALFRGNEVWHSDWRGTTVEIQDWVRHNFTGSLPHEW